MKAILSMPRALLVWLTLRALEDERVQRRVVGVIKEAERASFTITIGSSVSLPSGSDREQILEVLRSAARAARGESPPPPEATA